MYDLGTMIVALVPTFLVSRIILWLANSWDGGIPRIFVVNIFSWATCSYIAIGLAGGVEAAFVYFGGQPAARAADRLFAVFFRAPALCW